MLSVLGQQPTTVAEINFVCQNFFSLLLAGKCFSTRPKNRLPMLHFDDIIISADVSFSVLALGAPCRGVDLMGDPLPLWQRMQLPFFRGGLFITEFSIVEIVFRVRDIFNRALALSCKLFIFL